MKDMATGIIYFVAAENGAIKIGFTRTDAQRRLSSLQVGSPVRLDVVAAVAGTQYLEHQLHDYLSASRLHGEWFRRTSEVEQIIRKAISNLPLLHATTPTPAADNRPIPLTKQIVATLQSGPRRMWTSKTVAKKLRASRSMVGRTLYYLAQKGKILRAGPHTYRSYQIDSITSDEVT